MKTTIGIAILIPIIFIAGLVLMTNLWNNESGQRLGFLLFWGTMAWSVIHVVFIIVNRRLAHKLIWLVLTSLPILYLLFMTISGKD